MLLVRVSNTPFELLYVGIEVVTTLDSTIKGVITGLENQYVSIKWTYASGSFIEVDEPIAIFNLTFFSPKKCKKFLPLAEEVDYNAVS